MIRIKNREYLQKGCYFFLFIAMFMTIGSVYLKYPLRGELLVVGDGTSSVFITEWFGEQYASLQLPLWSRESAAGIPISSHMLGAFFLPSVLFSRLPLPWFTWLNYTFFIAFGACMFSRFLEEISIQRWLAVLMGFMLLFAVCYGGARKYHVAIIHSISLYPLVLFAFQRYINTQSRAAIVLAGIGMGSMLLVATPSIQYGMYLMMGMFAYVLVEAVHKRVRAGKIFADACLFLLVTVGIAAVQIIPGYELMQRYATESINKKISFASFTSYSVHPLKLLMMFFPNLLNNIYTSFGSSFSSEIDIELFLGTAAAATLLFGIIRCRFDRRVWLLTAIAACGFLFAANAHVPFLSKILYEIPLINSVRCPSRILFLFVLLELTVLTVILSYMSKNKLEILVFGRYLSVLIIVIIIVLSTVYFSPLYEILAQTGMINDNVRSVFYHSLVPLLLLRGMIGLGTIVLRGNRVRSEMVTVCITGAIVLLSIAETWPYSTENNFMVPENRIKPSADFQQMAEKLGNGKTITTHMYYDGTNDSETFLANRQLYTGVPSLNAYLTYNNPALYRLSGQVNSGDFSYYNYSGLLTGYTSIYQLLWNNDILSILGVKYIEDQKGLLTDGCLVKGERISQEAPVVDVEEIEIVPGDGVQIFAIPICVERDTFYEVSFNLTTEKAPELFYLDLYGTPDYDNDQQNVPLEVEPCADRSCTLTIYSGANPIPENTVLRIISINDSPISIRNFQVNRCSSIQGIYVPIRAGNDNLYYENTRAKELFYTVPYVKGLEDINEIGLNPFGFDFMETSYITDTKSYDYSNATAQITNIIWTSNHTVSTTVETDADTFVTFSQCYDPAWRVYLDGVRKENYQTNLALNGTFVPAGTHTLTYEYCPVIVYVSLGISILTALLSVVYLCITYLGSVNRTYIVPSARRVRTSGLTKSASRRRS